MVNHPRRSRKSQATVALAQSTDDDYAELLGAVGATFARYARGPLFTTDADGLNEIYLAHLGSERQFHTCYHCRRFLETYGGLVSITDDGHTIPAMWDAEPVPDFYQPAVAAMHDAVAKARVKGVFLSSEKAWGLPVTGNWTHFAVASPSVYQRRILTAGQAMAHKREDFITVARALSDFTPEMIAEALRLLEAGHLARSEKFVVPLQWLADLHAKRGAVRNARVRDNLLWRAVATAPDGYCHPRSAVTGTLLEDIAAGLSFDDVKARFDAKMHPLQYQRPQAAPRIGNLAEAEKVVERLGIARSLERRFARLDEIPTAWTPAKPRNPVRPQNGVFGHLKPRGAVDVRALDAPAATMTWDKFTRTVLPGADAIEVHIAGHMNFIALTTAEHADAPPVLKWDSADERNPVAWYVYHNGSAASQWGLLPGWANLSAIVQHPPMWGANPKPHLGEGFILIVDGCADTHTGQGNALFPECLTADLYAVRATIEAYSRHAEMQGRENASACGLDIRKGATNIGYRLRVASDGLKTEYHIDRWD